MFGVIENTTLEQQANIKTIGIGGGGGNTVAHMLKLGHHEEGLEFIMANTDQQALRNAGRHALVIGETLTQGLGAGAKPEIGRQAAEESENAIQDRLEGADMLFITAGMGGGTGTGAAPVIARLARSMGILTIAIVTRPFSFEGIKRQRLADEGIKALAEEVDSLITIPNDKLLAVMGKNASLLTAFDAVNDVLKDAVLGISEMITAPGMINVDFADVRTVMSSQGFAKIGTGMATGENRAEEAAMAAINSPLLDDVQVNGAKGLLVNISAGLDLSIGEFNAVGEALRGYVGDDATVVIGTSVDMEKSEEIKVSVVVTGLGEATPISSAPSQQQQKKPAFISPRSSMNTTQQEPASDRRREAPQRDHHPIEQAPRYPNNSADNEDMPKQKVRQRRPSLTEEEYLDIPAFLRRTSAGH
jgi:cell division protein FtsZ